MFDWIKFRFSAMAMAGWFMSQYNYLRYTGKLPVWCPRWFDTWNFDWMSRLLSDAETIASMADADRVTVIGARVQAFFESGLGVTIPADLGRRIAGNLLRQWRAQPLRIEDRSDVVRWQPKPIP